MLSTKLPGLVRDCPGKSFPESALVNVSLCCRSSALDIRQQVFVCVLFMSESGIQTTKSVLSNYAFEF